MSIFTCVVFLIGTIIIGSSCQEIKTGVYSMGVVSKQANHGARLDESTKFKGYFYAHIENDTKKVTITRDFNSQQYSNAEMTLKHLAENNGDYEVYVLLQLDLLKETLNENDNGEDYITYDAKPILPENVGKANSSVSVVDQSHQVSFKDLELQDKKFKMGYVKHEKKGEKDKGKADAEPYAETADKLRDFFFVEFFPDNKVKITADLEVIKSTNAKAKKSDPSAKKFEAKNSLENLKKKVDDGDRVYALRKVQLTKIPDLSVETTDDEIKLKFEVIA